jgi:prolyl oligopeptidase
MNVGPTLLAPDDDPHLWLEGIGDATAVAWVDDQNARTLARFGNAAFETDRDALAAIYDRPENIPYVWRRGAHLYNFWRDARNPRGLWRRTTLESFQAPQTEWDILLDIDALAEAENEDWIWGGASTLPGTHEKAILRLSRGGGDAVVLREFDLCRRTFAEDGFHLAEAKGGAEWLDAEYLLLHSALGEKMATESGYSRTVRLWRRGTPVEDSPVLFETNADSMCVWSQPDRTQNDETIWFIEQSGFYAYHLWIGDRSGPQTRLDLPEDIWSLAHGDWLAVMPRSSWELVGRSHAPGTLLGIRLSSFLAGDRSFSVLFEPGERRALQNFFWCNGQVVLSVLDNLRPVHEALIPSDSGWTRSELSGLPDNGVVEIWRLDIDVAESNGDLLVNAQDPLTPPSMSLIESAKDPQILRQAPAAFDADGLTISRHEAVSIDGERIPYVQVGPAREIGEAPVHLYGYGGFQHSQLPYYNSAIGRLWLERGGTSVIAQIRGGGEFGPKWHEAGCREGKHLSHDDFAAVADDLVRRGVTRAQRIGAEGGSNGGLLIANMLTRYPERFGALFCTIPLIDMRRYSKLLAGASWIAEYGDPDKPEDWAFLQNISAYHAATPGKGYPPILLATARKDDRVHPGHARKMTAKLQAMGHEAYFFEPASGGHGYGKDNLERAGFTALGYAFLRDKIGWFPETE